LPATGQRQTTASLYFLRGTDTLNDHPEVMFPPCQYS